MLMALKSSYSVFWTTDLNFLLILGIFVYITQTWNSTCANLTATGPNLTSIFPHKTRPVPCVPYFSYKITSSHSPKLESWIFWHFVHPAFSIGYHVLEILLLLLLTSVPPVFQLPQALSAYKDCGNKLSTARLFLSFPSLQIHCCLSFIFLTKHFWWLCTAYRLRSKVPSMLFTLWPPLVTPRPLPLCPSSSYSSHRAYGLAKPVD